MENKTCGECKHFVQSNYLDVCTVFSEVYKPDSSGEMCDYFELKVITNGDVIRQMSNEKLAELFDNTCKVCSRSVTECDCECVKGILNWLNAPAESDGEE